MGFTKSFSNEECHWHWLFFQVNKKPRWLDLGLAFEGALQVECSIGGDVTCQLPGGAHWLTSKEEFDSSEKWEWQNLGAGINKVLKIFALQKYTFQVQLACPWQIDEEGLGLHGVKPKRWTFILWKQPWQDVSLLLQTCQTEWEHTSHQSFNNIISLHYVFDTWLFCLLQSSESLSLSLSQCCVTC